MLSLEQITTREGFIGLKEDWNRLVERSPVGSLLLRHEWVFTWWKHFGQGRDLRICVVRENGEVVAIAPLCLYRGAVFNRFSFPKAVILETLGNYHSNRVDLLYETFRLEYLELIWAELCRWEDWHFTRIYPLLNSSPTMEGLRELSHCKALRSRFLPSQVSPFIPIDEDWRAFQNRVSKEIRRKGRKAERSARSGDLEFQLVTQVSKLDELMDEIYGVAEKGWAAEAKTAISSTADLRGFYSELAEVANQNGWLYFGLLRLSGRPAAFEYNLRYRGVILNLKVGYDPAFSGQNPGHSLTWLILREAFKKGVGVREFDFVGDLEPYKLKWTNEMRPHSKVTIYRSGSPYASALYLLDKYIVDSLRKWRKR